MKHFFTLLFAFLFSLTLCAQFVFDPDVIVLASSGEDLEVKIDFINNSEEFTEVYWMFTKGEGFPEDWLIDICDKRTCYVEVDDGHKSNMNLPNEMNPGDTMVYKFIIKANGVPGSSYAIINAFDDANCKNEIAVSKAPISSVSDEDFESIVIYPNPASEYFQVKNDDQVKKVVVTSITGKIMLSVKHTDGKSHSIQDLPKGVFFVILKDENGDKIKTLRLIK